MKRFATMLSFWLFRAPLAVLGGFIIGQLTQVVVAILIDLVWQNDVTGGKWSFSLPNIILVCVSGLVTGFSTGWIAGSRGKLLGAIVTWLPFLLFVTLMFIENVDLSKQVKQTYNTNPALWIWIAFIPGIIGGHFGALNGKRYFNQSALFCSLMFSQLANIGFTIFHFYTIYVAFKIAGYIAAGFTLILPGVAELYWVWRIWISTGQFLNHYTSLLLIPVSFLIISGVGLIAFQRTMMWNDLNNTSNAHPISTDIQ